MIGSWVAALLAACAFGDQPQWGQRHTRNMVSAEKGLPDSFDPATKKNVRWKVRIGTKTYGTPVVAGGRILIGTNNGNPRDPRFDDDRGVLLCLDERDGSFLWQLALAKRGPSAYWDWPGTGLCSPATVEGDRIYILTNRGEVVALDPKGMANGNDGPYKDEARLLAPKEGKPVEPGPADADVLWLIDLTKKLGVRQHDGAVASILVDGPFLYLNTCNGLNDKHDRIPSPKAPSLLVLEKSTGRVVSREEEGISGRIFHCAWSSPALGAGRIFFGGEDGVCYAFEALRDGKATGALKLAWKYDCDPGAPKEFRAIDRERQKGPSTIKAMPVFHDGRVYVVYGGDVWWGKRASWLGCIDASEGSRIWTYPLKRQSMSTPAVHDGLVYAVDCGGLVHCVDAATGEGVWTHDAKGDMWASPLVADGKVYIGTRRGTFWILAAGREKRVYASVQLDAPMNGSPSAANGVLYVATMETLYAVSK